ncbi:MAG: exodeoxyribonuclease VII large subunit [Deltaproteobacteria bacterium]|nr:exodeoxyribonuclease VII large subunit [Deltaproteobacteria bacterium]
MENVWPQIVERRIYSVSRLNEEIKTLLEAKFGFIWVEGEVSNLSRPSSGHLYFTLKDAHSQIHGVMFKFQNRLLKFKLEDGLKVVGHGRVSLYQPRGDYQLIFEYLEPAGLGGLQLAFEQLKKRLKEEGLFDPGKKRPLPFLPAKIALVTSPTGAAVRDFLKILNQRFSGLEVLIYPVRVQGEGAAKDIAAALTDLNRFNDVDLVVVTRGGGSLEDLWAFNEEVVARAVAASRHPVVSAVGHEIDLSICDLVADVRAATPTAAAEMIVPRRSDLVAGIRQLEQTLSDRVKQTVSLGREKLRHISARLISPSRRLADQRLRLDDLTGRLIRSVTASIKSGRREVDGNYAKLRLLSPIGDIRRKSERLTTLRKDLDGLTRTYLGRLNQRLGRMAGSLDALSPLAVLARGYSLSRRLPDLAIVKDAAMLTPGDAVNIMFARGAAEVRVEKLSRAPEET